MNPQEQTTDQRAKYLRGKLLDWVTAPYGDPAGKAMCFMQGGAFNGDRGSIIAPAPELLAIHPCNCSPAGLEAPCNQATHWHDVALGEELGDIPRHSAYYVLVRSEPAPSGMVAALYWHAGYERPTQADIQRARNDFDRTLRTRAARLGVPPETINQ